MLFRSPSFLGLISSTEIGPRASRIAVKKSVKARRSVPSSRRSVYTYPHCRHCSLFEMSPSSCNLARRSSPVSGATRCEVVDIGLLFELLKVLPESPGLSLGHCATMPIGLECYEMLKVRRSATLPPSGTLYYGDNQERCGAALRTTTGDTHPAMK